MAWSWWKSHGRVISEPTASYSQPLSEPTATPLSPTTPTSYSSYWARRYFGSRKSFTINPLVTSRSGFSPRLSPRPGTRITVVPDCSIQHEEFNMSPTHRSSSVPPRWPSPWIYIPQFSDVASPGYPASFHDSSTTYSAGLANPLSSGSKKSLNVESPSFTPTQLGGKKSNFSTNATPFTPRGASTCEDACFLMPYCILTYVFNSYNFDLTTRYGGLAV